MFSFFLFSFSHSSFLPYSVTNNVYLDILSDKQFAKAQKRLPKIATLVIDEEDPYSRDYEYIFSKLPTIFSSELQFCVITSASAKKTYSHLKLRSPSIVFTTNAQLSFVIPFPATESELIAVISYFMSSNSKMITDKKELYDSLGATAYTLIATPKLLEIADQIRISLSDIYGIFTVLCVSPELLKELGFQPYKLLIYRQSDKVLTEIGSTQDSIRRAITPNVITHIRREEIEGSASPLALLVTNRKLTGDEKKGILDLAQQYPEYAFCSADIEETDFVQELLINSHLYTDIVAPYFLVFHPQEYYFYPHGNKEFTLESAHKYLEEIAKGSIKKVFPSEPLPITQSSPFLTKVVGQNYEQFVNDEDKDVLMFYLYEENEQTLDFPRYVASYLNQTEIKCGYIYLRLNSAPVGFPTLFGNPHIQFFPAYKKDLNSTYYGSRGIFSLLNFLRRNSRSKINLDMNLLDRNYEMSYLIDLINDMGDFPQDIQLEVTKYIEETGKALGIGSNIQQITDTLYKAQSGFTE